MPTVKQLMAKREVLRARKQPWEYPYQILGKYIYTRKQEFQQTVSPGAFLNDGMINDSTAVRANGAMASAIMGALWKSGGKTFRIRKPRHIPDTKANQDYYMRINEVMAEAMESPKAGFETAFDESLREEGAFGTSGIAEFKGDYQNPLIFKSWSIQSVLIAEGADGFVDTVYYDDSVPLAVLVDTYGLAKLPKDLQEKYKSPKFHMDRIKVCIAIEPRREKDRKGKGDSDLGMEVASYHFTFEGTPHMLRESGFTEMPVRISRWYKLANEEYGRSPGMDALPAIMQLNAFKETFLICVEKKAEPPLYILDDGSLGGGAVDTSVRGLSVFNSFGRAPGQPPIGQIHDIGELQSLAAAIAETREEITQHFLIDKLYDLNNKSRMTLGEAEMRYQIRSDALSSIYARKTAETLNPLITRSFNILFEMGLLGITPEDEATANILIANGLDPIIIPADVAQAIVMGKDIYKIDYISPAAHVMREEEYRGVITTGNNAMQAMQVNPAAGDKFNFDKFLEYSRELTGAPMDILFSDDEVKKIRDDRAEAQRAEQETLMAREQAAALKDTASAQASMTGG
ncbi:MAG: portal protein [Candidatus Aadella gelida]|nr:portal protein [Candidatus Aadella gelida]